MLPTAFSSLVLNTTNFTISGSNIIIGSESVPTNYLVYQTGSQTISGSKDFKDETTFSNIAYFDDSIKSHNTSAYINLEDQVIYDLNSGYSVSWGNRLLTNASGTATILWDTRGLYGTGNAGALKQTVDWGNKYLYSLISNTEKVSLDWGGYNLKWNNIKRLNWQTGLAYNSGQILTLDWNSGLLYDHSSVLSLDWENRWLKDEVGDVCVEWSTRSLVTSSITVSLDWDAKQLYGDWSTTTTPTQSGNLINYGYLTGKSIVTSTGTAPSNTGTPVRWMPVNISGTNYRIPLYQ